MPASELKSTDPKKLPGIFISYRRSDNPDAVGRIYDRLVSEFGKARVFKDVDSIPLGQDFRGHLNDVVGGCAAVLAIIGPKWADARDEAGQRRLENPDDFVRIELEAALARNIPVVPVLVGHAANPGKGELPGTLATMAFRQSIEVRPDPDFHNDATRLVSALRLILDPNARVVEHSRHWWLPWLAALAAAALLAAIALAVPAFRYWSLQRPSETRTEISVPTQQAARGAIALSPDGEQIVAVVTEAGVSRLWLRPLASTTGQLLPGTEGANGPFWSPDSKSIGFFTSNSLKRMDVGGGAPLTLAPVTFGPGGTWNPDGTILFAQGVGKPLARIDVGGGAVTEVTRLGQEAVVHANPLFLPDGRRFLFLAIGGAGPGIYLGSLDGSAPVRLTSVFGAFAYHPSGWLLLWQESQAVLIAQRLDVDKAALVGAPITLAQGTGAVSASATGMIAYLEATSGSGVRELRWRSRTGDQLGVIGEPNVTYFAPRVSRDGRRVAVVRGDSEKRDVWLLEGARSSRATFDSNANAFPLWSPDGKRIVFTSDREVAPGLYLRPADGAGEEELLLGVGSVSGPSSWSPDGRHLMFVFLDPKTGLDLQVLPMTGDRKPWSFLNSRFGEGGGEFSPDGKWVAYESDESERREVYIRPFVVPGEGASSEVRAGKWQVSTDGGTYPKWSPDGKELYFLNPAGEMMAAPITIAGTSLTPGTPVKLFNAQVLGGGTDFQQGPQYDVAPDGRFLINTVPDAEATATSSIILIQNWNPDAKNN
jgi:eukaryotic-like serine/threonine-protein kinase